MKRFTMPGALGALLACAAACGSSDPPPAIGGSAGGAAEAGSGGTTASAEGGRGGTSSNNAGSGGAPASGGAVSAGGSAGAAGGGATGELGRFLPLRAGNTWIYQVERAGTLTTKTTIVGAEELVGGDGPNSGELAFRIVTTKSDDGMAETVSWQALRGPRAVRYREQTFAPLDGLLEQEETWSPYKLRVDEAPELILTGASWVEQYDETKLPVGQASTTASNSDTWTVLAESESVTVPAGTFDALVVQRVGGTAQKTYWFARGVGKVKETGGQTELLESYDVQP